MQLRSFAALLTLTILFAAGATAQSLKAPALYPNPVSADGILTVEVVDADAARAEVLDVLGRRVSLDAPLASGTYLVRAVYADGRTTAPARFTTVASGRVEIRLAEAGAPLAPEAAASAPLAAEANKGGCAVGDVVFGGFYHTAAVGQLQLRPDLSPMSMRVKTANNGNNEADFTTCLGAGVNGVAFRYVAGGDPGNRPLRILSPASIGNTSLTYEVQGSDGGNPFTADFGTNETTVDDDGDINTPEAPAAQFFLNSPFFPGGLGLYELIVFDGSTPVYRQNVDGADGLYITSNGAQQRINVLRSIVLTSVVDGFAVSGGTKPGDVSFAFEFESGDGSDVNVHVGAGVPVSSGTSIHITPKFNFGDVFDTFITSIRTRVTGMNRFGLRALRFATGGDFSDAQWGRVDGSFLDPQLVSIFGPNLGGMFLGDSFFGNPPSYGVQFGREPSTLEETGSDGIGVLHAYAESTPGNPPEGVLLDDDGEYYQLTALVRNATDAQGETITARVENNNSMETVLTVTNQNGTFATYQFVYDANEDGTVQIKNTYAVGNPITFGPNDLGIFGSGAFDYDDTIFDLGDTQDFFLAFAVDLGNGKVGIAYIFPDWTSPNANVDVRTITPVSGMPFQIVQHFEDDSSGARPAARRSGPDTAKSAFARVSPADR